jgi:hypothetical protein
MSHLKDPRNRLLPHLSSFDIADVQGSKSLTLTALPPFHLSSMLTPTWSKSRGGKTPKSTERKGESFRAFVSNRRGAVVTPDHTSIEQLREEVDGSAAPWVVGGERTSQMRIVGLSVLTLLNILFK